MAGKTLSRVRAGLRALHKDEQGADMLEYILILAAIVVPILGLVLWFRNEIYTWAVEKWREITGKAEDLSETPP